MNQNVPNNDAPRETPPNWAQMRREDFDEAAPMSLFDVPAAPVTGGLFDLHDDGQDDDGQHTGAVVDEVAAVPVDEPLYGEAAARVGGLLADGREDYQRAETARRGQDRRDDANLGALSGPVGEGSPADAVRELLAAVLDALDIPAPATTGGSEAHDRVLCDRAMHAKIALRDVLDGAPLGIE